MKKQVSQCRSVVAVIDVCLKCLDNNRAQWYMIHFGLVCVFLEDFRVFPPSFKLIDLSIDAENQSMLQICASY